MNCYKENKQIWSAVSLYFYLTTDQCNETCLWSEQVPQLKDNAEFFSSGGELEDRYGVNLAYIFGR